MAWTLASSVPRVFTRSVDNNEIGFYHDLRFNGTANIIECVTVKTQSKSLFDKRNVARTWIALKQLYPLLGASMHEDPVTQDVSFHVSEPRLSIIEPKEIQFGEASSANTAVEFLDALNSGPSQVSEDLLARLYVFSRRDEPDCFHVILHYAHLIIDGISGMTAVRMFFDILSLPPSSIIPDLETRLSLVIGAQNLGPSARMPLVRRRWRYAIAKVIHNTKNATFQGGTALPRKITTHTFFTPSKSRSIYTHCAEEMSQKIIAKCRMNKLTFGHAHPVLSQISGARILHRRYLRGEISEEEWQWRKREPFHTHGPLNLRPYLDPAWFKSGGDTVISLCINFFQFKLPFMPAISYSRKHQQQHVLDNGAPPVASLLSNDRFLLRCNMIKKQSRALMKHPLFFEIANVKLPIGIDARRAAKGLWEQTFDGKTKELEVPIPSTMTDAVVFASGGSNFGDVDRMRSLDYPLPQNHPFSSRFTGPNTLKIQALPSDLEVIPSSMPKPKAPADAYSIHIVDSASRLRCRPAELYLGSSMKNRQLFFWVSFDANVYEEVMVQEWLGEFKAVAEFYLGSEDALHAKL